MEATQLGTQRFRYTLKVLTPLHIGTGERVPIRDYHRPGTSPKGDPADVVRLDLERSIEGYIQEKWAGTGGEDLTAVYEYAKAHWQRYRRYNLRAENEVINSIEDGKREVLECVKTFDGAYIPGSSIKGAIRTAILSYIAWYMTWMFFSGRSQRGIFCGCSPKGSP